MASSQAGRIEELKAQLVGKTIVDLTYDEEDDYFIITIDNDGRGAEFSFRFMADLVREQWKPTI